MNLLPIVHRELRIGARRRSTHVSRAVVGGVMVLLWLTVVLANANRSSTAELARVLFWLYGLPAMLYALLTGVFFTADSLSSERRNGTLGLLFLTDLLGADVVLGKLVATSWNGVYSLLALVPVLSLPVLMGGVSVTETLRFVVLILSCLFLSLSLGLLVSTLCRRLVSAVAMTFFIVLLLCAVPWLFGALLDELSQWKVEGNPSILLSPFTSLAGLADLSYARAARGGRAMSGAMLFWFPVGIAAALGAACLLGACGLLPRLWRREQQPAPARPPKTPAAAPAIAAKSGAAAGSHLDEDPCRWLARRNQAGYRGLRVALGVLLAVWVLFLGLSSDRRTSDLGFFVAVLTAFAIHTLIKTWLAMEATRRFSEERESGAMELLLVTPVSAGDVVRGEAAALERTFRWPLGLAGAVNVVLIAVALADPVSMGKDRWWFAEILLWGGAILWLDAATLRAVGMLRGLKSAGHHRAAMGTFVRVLLPPWVGVVLFFVLIVLPGARFGLDELLFCMRGWFLACAALDFLMIKQAGVELVQHLRTLAAGEEPAFADGSVGADSGAAAAP